MVQPPYYDWTSNPFSTARARNLHAEGESIEVISSRPQGWSETRRRFRASPRLARLRIPVLVAAAALCGAAVSAAALVGLWNGEVNTRHAVEAKLATSQQRAKTLAAANANLRAGLADTRATSFQVERTSARLRAEARSLLTANTKLIATARGLHASGSALQRRALSVSKLAAALGNDVVNVLHYVTNTSIGSLDPAYLKAQLDYLQPAVAGIRSAADALATDAGDHASAVDRFTAQAASYASALGDLARAQAAAKSR
jgi:hypothetical protein